MGGVALPAGYGSGLFSCAAFSVGYAVQLIHVQNFYITTLYIDMAVILEFAEYTTKGFCRQGQVVGDIMSRHVQVKFGG